jgi:tetratricopeptide (TPR) repeat protein
VARRLDPLSLAIATDHGVILYYARRYPEAIDQFRAVMDVDPSFRRALMIHLPYAHEKRFDEALALIQRWRSSESPWTDALAAYTYGQLGRAQDAQKALEKMEESVRRSNLPEAIILEMRIVAYCGMGLKDKVLAALEQACETREPFLTSLKVRPMYDLVRDDPRFQEILRCVGLAP